MYQVHLTPFAKFIALLAAAVVLAGTFATAQEHDSHNTNGIVTILGDTVDGRINMRGQ